MRQKLIIVVLACLLAVFTDFSAFSAKKKKPSLGEKLYNKSCKICHGKQGEGASAPNIQNKSLRDFKDSFDDGPGVMPEFKSTRKKTKAIMKFVTR